MLESESHSPNDEALMASYVAGDGQALAQLFERYGTLLLRVMMRGGYSEADAADMVQQTFLQLHRARADFRPDAKLKPWLFTIALNVKRQLIRTRKRRPEAALELDGRDDPKVEAYDPVMVERRRLVRQALAQLPDAQREVIELHWLAGMAFSEVSQIVGASLSAVKVRAHRGYARLKEELSRLGISDAELINLIPFFIIEPN
jgi:RNA polymerase sigma-70 factor (ECF subfamily)